MSYALKARQYTSCDLTRSLHPILSTQPVAVDECGDIILVCYADTSIARFARASESLLPVTVAGPSGRPLAPPRSKRPPRWSKTHIYERVTSKPVSDIIALADFGVVLALHSGLVTVLDASQQQAMIDRGAIDGSKGTHAIAFVPESSLLACCKGRSIALFRCTHPPHDDPATPDDAAPEIEPAPGPIRSPMFGENIRHELAMRTPIGPAHFKAVHTVDIGEWVYG